MARFDVHAGPEGVGYLLDVQADVLADLNTRVVVPLMPVDRAPAPARRLNPVLEVDGVPCVLVTQFMAAVPRSMLGRPVANLSGESDGISGALDMLLIGF